MVIKRSINDVTANMTCDIVITGMRTWRWRVALGKMLMLLGAWIIGMKVDVNFR